MTDRPPYRYAIPPATPAIECRSCGAPIVFVKTTNGKNMPVQADGPHRGESHFSHCPNAQQHSAAHRRTPPASQILPGVVPEDMQGRIERIEEALKALARTLVTLGFGDNKR